MRAQFHQLYDELIADDERNRLIGQDVTQALRDGRSPLVLTERNEHLDALIDQLATEAFLFRRLETLAETAGRFRLNAELPIAFDGWGRMEVDLLCAQPRIAAELDGSQHLGDAEAYRRDRRKDALLQEYGYRVLRFLAEDVGKNLDQVLDAILRALSHQSAGT